MNELLDDYDPVPGLVARGVMADPAEHAFWGTDPSGYCGCEDCNAPDDVPPEGTPS